MGKYRMVRTGFWKNPIVMEEMTPEDRYFYLYLLTNPHTTQIGIYKITKKQMAFDLGYSLEKVHSLMERFSLHHKLIQYNPETRELAIKNWGKYNLGKGGKPVMDCIFSELKEVEDASLVEYVMESILKHDIRSLYESFCGKKEIFSDNEGELNTYIDLGDKELDDTLLHQNTIRGQKEKEEEKEKEKEKQQQKEKQQPLYPDIENTTYIQHYPFDVKDIVEFWDQNGFGFSNINGKKQLLAWLDDSRFLQPKELILKAMKIACANNKRRLSYVVGILKNWENEELLTVEEIDSYQENEKPKTRPLTAGRDIPDEFELNLTAGED
ncbi:DnaD domain protein [Bacillus sp. 31A1R]|uniref:DnaD domain protein n=1 Tax=Robertmurraya mangrovi TaxID=3098077 RepID=A0ABU5J2B9_9BACI|nr:DnaD domain protein [Bacillus sp. 31A1R]MDZ5473554.1 DnaD domain protein [Bacillus sp. 31A1R]